MYSIDRGFYCILSDQCFPCVLDLCSCCGQEFQSKQCTCQIVYRQWTCQKVARNIECCQWVRVAWCIEKSWQGAGELIVQLQNTYHLLLSLIWKQRCHLEGRSIKVNTLWRSLNLHVVKEGDQHKLEQTHFKQLKALCRFDLCCRQGLCQTAGGMFFSEEERNAPASIWPA